MEIKHQTHEFEPFYMPDSRFLILGSFPSVKSREQAFYYGHPQNRFWPLMARLFEDAVPFDIPQKKAFLIKHRLALWDVIDSCDIAGSSDASIKNEVPCHLPVIMDNCPIKQILLNGALAHKLYKKYWATKPWIYEKLPSTSPANAAWSIDRLYAEWSRILKM